MTEPVTDTADQPVATVRAWWQALQDRDLDALGMTLDEHHVAAGGPGGRTLGKDAALADARGFLQEGSVDTWTISEIVEQIHGQVAVCSYAWDETGRHDGFEFRFAGVATDVLRWLGSSWVITAHHTTLTTPAGDPT